jgi:hypothetical protein
MAKIKVSQKTIDQIKNLGMTKALKSAGSMKSNATYMEGLRRMYGAERVNKALGSTGAPSSANKNVQNKLKAMGSTGSGKKVSGFQAEAKTVKAFRANTGQRMNDYRQGAQMLRTQQESLNKRVKAMAPAERRAYYGTQAKSAAGLVAGIGASVVGGAGIASVAAGSKIIAGGVKAAQVASKTKKGVAAAKAAAAKNVPPRSYAGIKTTAGLGSIAGIAGSGKKKK